VSEKHWTVPPATMQGYSFGGEKAVKMLAWLEAIKRDRNFGRLLFGLPLRAPLSPAMRRYLAKTGETPEIVPEPTEGA